jgi:O-antigen/teichoic acid export membrane protein
VAANLLSVATGSVDKIVVGRLLGPTAVGLYSLAYGLAFVFKGQVGPRLYQLAFPAFAEAQNDPERSRRGVLKMLQILFSVSVPFSVLIGLRARDVLAVAYGAQWTVSAPVLASLAVGAAFSGLTSGLYPLLLARGRSKAQFLTNIAGLGVFLSIAPWAIAWWGLVGAGVASVASAAASATLSAAVASRDLAIGWRLWLRAACPSLFAGLTMAASVLATGTILKISAPWLPSLWSLVLVGSVGAGAYTFALWRSDPEMLRWVGAYATVPFRNRARPSRGNDRSG